MLIQFQLSDEEEHGNVIAINPDHVTSVHMMNGDCYIYTSDDHQWCVKGKMVDIVAMLNGES